MTMRLFFALEPPHSLKEALAAFLAERRALPLRASWADPGKLHLTLAFLGEQPEERLPALQEIGGEVARRNPLIRLQTSGLGAFPRPSRARVLWLGLERDPALASLAEDLRASLREAGIPMEEGPFAAHVTLARFRQPVDISPLEPGPAPLSFEAPELVLFRSHLEPKGALYEKIGAYPFSGSSF